MVGLLDIAPLTTTVKLGKEKIEVVGISAKGVACILQDFPQFAGMLSGGTLKGEELLAAAPDMVAAIIAAGTGTPGNDQAIERASMLPVEYQLDLLEAIIKISMPSGPAPFMRRLTGLLNSMGASSNSVGQRKTTAPTSTGKETDSPLLQPLKG